MNIYLQFCTIFIKKTVQVNVFVVPIKCKNNFSYYIFYVAQISEYTVITAVSGKHIPVLPNEILSA